MVLILTKEPAGKKACRWGKSYSQYDIKHSYKQSIAYGQKCHNYEKYNCNFFHEHNGSWLPVAYISSIFTLSQQNHTEVLKL